MSNLESLSVPAVEALQLTICSANRLKLDGQITLRDPVLSLGEFFRSVHLAAVADKLPVLELDLTGLKFVNSSSIRLFLDWASWIQSMPSGAYQLHILTSRQFTWQRTSFVAITALAKGCVEVRQAG
jgi:hypothetical protein